MINLSFLCWQFVFCIQLYVVGSARGYPHTKGYNSRKSPPISWEQTVTCLEHPKEQFKLILFGFIWNSGLWCKLIMFIFAFCLNAKGYPHVKGYNSGPLQPISWEQTQTCSGHPKKQFKPICFIFMVKLWFLCYQFLFCIYETPYV